MITYEYKCKNCDYEFKAEHSINYKVQICPHCNKDTLIRLISNRGGFILKGNNWEKKNGY